MRTTICIKVTDENNHSVGSFRIDYVKQEKLDEALKRALPILLMDGMMIPEHLEFPLDLSGVKIQQNTNKERKQRYEETGN
jgi:hypothetical protein